MKLLTHYLDDGYEGYCRFLSDIRPAVEELKKNGMTFAYHSHSFEFVRHHQQISREAAAQFIL